MDGTSVQFLLDKFTVKDYLYYKCIFSLFDILYLAVPY